MALQCSTPVALLIAAVTALAVAVHTFGVPFLSGSSPYWVFPEGDVNQWMIGWNYFAQDPWRIPLFHTDKIQPPDGISLIYLDPTPWFACLAKLILPAHTNPYPLWVLLTFALQGIAATLVIRQCGFRGAAHAAGVTLILVTVHAFLIRWGMTHASLSGHFVVVLALWVYLRWRDRSTSARETLIWIGVLALAALTQPYLFLMCAAFAGAALIRDLSSWRALARMAAQILAIASVTMGLLYLAGYFPLPHYAKGVDAYFGPTAMNLLGPFLPLESPFIPWVRFGDFDPTGIGYDVCFYPGLSVFLLLLFLLIARRKALRAALRRHSTLVIACVPLTIYAILPQVRFGKHLLFDAHLPVRVAEALSVARITGRFFLPVSYVLIFGALVLGLSGFRRTTSALLLLLLGAAQFVESAPQRRGLTKAYSHAYDVTLDAATWTPLIREHQRIEQLPSFQCMTWTKDFERRAMTSRELQLLAAKSYVEINGAYGARLLKDCEPERGQLASISEHLGDGMRDDTLYVLFEPYVRTALVAAAPAGRCAKFHAGYVCSKRWDRPPLAQIRGRFGALPESFPPFASLGSTLEVKRQGRGLNYVGTGWSYPEPGHMWTAGKEAALMFPKLPTDKPLRFAMNAEAFLDEQFPKMDVEVMANGTSIAHWSFSGDNNAKNPPREALIPPHVLAPSGDLHLRLRINSPHKPTRVPDDRLLGLAVTHILVSEAPQDQPK